MMYWNINESASGSSLPGGATNFLNDLTDVAIANPQADQILKYDGSQFINSNIPAINNIDASQVTTGTLNPARLPNLAGIVLGGDAVPPYISSITPITPSGPQTIEIIGEYFSPITQLSIPGVLVNNLEVRSPTKIVASISKSGLSGNKIITLSNGSSSNQLWSEGIKSINIQIDPYLQNVSLWLKGDGENNSPSIIDSSPNPKAITVIGDAKISTTQSKYGGSSLYFDGTGDMIRFPVHTDFNFTGPFTVESWIYSDKTGDLKTIIQIGTPTMFIIRPRWINPSVGYLYFVGNALLAINHAVFTANTWHHIAFTRDNSDNWRFFVDGILNVWGTQAGTVTGDSGNNFIGGGDSGQGSWQGFLDNLRITKGIARYTTNFNPETDTYLNT